MRQKLSPLEIKILLHYYTCADEYENITCEPANDFLNTLVKHEILNYSSKTENGAHYSITDKGIVYVQAIIETASNVGEPVMEWIIPNEEQSQ